MTRANRCLAWIGAAACAGIVLFICATIVLGKQPAWVQLEVVLVLALVAVFAFNPGLKKGAPARAPREVALTALLMAGSVATGAYMLANYQAIAAFREGVPNARDMAVYIAGTLIVLEGSRRAEGWILLVVVLAAVASYIVAPIRLVSLI